MTTYTLGEHRPRLGRDVFIAPGATVVGTVGLGNECSVWFGAVLRGDNEPIEIGPRSNVQDASVIHTDPGFPVELGTGVTVGHRVVLHGCLIGDGSLIGIGSVILNGARIGRQCLVGASTLITEGKEIPDRSLVLGAPGKVVRTLTDDEIEGLRRAAAVYVDKTHRYLRELTSG
jgi:carbonic anhydrase/acetyltransferase-like protein (isoleucine patch superfamily)